MSASNKRPVAGSRSPARSKTDIDASRRMRMGLLGSTALIAASLAVSPAFAQTTVVASPGDPDPASTAIAGGTTLQLNNTSGSVNWLDGYVFTGTGTLETNASGGASSFALRSEMRMSAGGLLNINTGTFAGSSDGLGNWANNLGSLNINAGAIFDGVEGAIFVDALTGSGTLRGGFGGSRTTTIGVANGSGTFNGVITNSAGNPLALTHVGTGVQTLTGVNTYTGATTISGGTIALSGSGSIAQSDSLNVGSGATFDISGLAAGTSVNSLQGAGSVVLGANTLTATGASSTFSGSITGSGGFTHAGTNTLTLSGINNWTGVTTVNGGFLRGTVNSISGSSVVILGGAFLEIDQASPGTFTQDISGAGTVRILGSGVQTTLSGNITTTGALVHQSGNANLVLSGTRSNSNVDGVQVNGTLSITDTGQVLGGGRVGVFIQNPSTLNNRGTITNTGQLAGGFGVAGSAVSARSGTVVNNGAADDAAAVISGSLYGVHHRDAGAMTLTNFGTVSGGSNAVHAVGAITITNNATGAISGGTAGVFASGALTLVNTGTISGAYGVDSDAGVVNLTNAAGGVISGTTAAIRLSSSGLATLNLNLGSTVTGQILSDDTGARTATVAGLLDGAYDAASGSGVDTITLASTGSITGAVTLGAGDDVFNWQGGTFGSTINAGTGTADVFNTALGVGVVGTLSLNSLSNFDTYNLVSGDLTLMGARNGGAVWNTSAGTTLNLTGQLTNLAGTGFAITAAAGSTVNVLGTGVLDSWIGIYFNGGATSTATNSGSITGQSTGIFSTSGRVNFTNNVGGTVSTAGASGGTAIALASGGGTIVNNGSVSAVTNALTSANTGTGASASSLTNAGTLEGISAGVVMNGAGAFNVINTSSINGSAVNTGVGIFQTAGTVTIANNAGGSISGNGYAVNTTGGSLNLTNASGATISGGSVASIQAATSGTAAIDLLAGSTTTGDIILSGTGARTLTVAGAFNGNLDATGNSGAVNLALNTSATGYTLLSAGSGADTLTFNGSGSRTFSVDNLTSWNTGAFTGGAWTLTGTGNATSFTSGLALSGGSSVSISNTQQLQGATGLSLTGGSSLLVTASLTNARTIAMAGAGVLGVSSGQTLTQSGVISGGGALTLNGLGTTILSGNNTYNGGTTVNSGILQLGHVNGAGTGVIHLIDPQINFAVTGTYNNDISLEVVNGQQAADPTILNNTSGSAITLAGRIYETAGVGGAGQYVTFNGGSITLSNSLNSWGGVTRINSGATLLGTTASISGASIVNNGTLTYQNASAGTGAQNMSGSGAININGTAATTLSGAITTTGQLTVSGAGANLILGGTRSGANNTGAVISGAGASLTVANGASLQSGQYNAVRVTSAGSSITNLGLIQNAGTVQDGNVGAGIYVLNGGAGGTTTVNNGSITDTGAGSTIQGRNAGVRHANGSTDLLVVNNYGLIVGDLYNGIENTAGGLTVNNFAGGYITATLGDGVSSASASAVSVTNAGVIGRNIAGNVTVNGYGVFANGALTLVNQTGGLIVGNQYGIRALSGGSITNQAGGQIRGETLAGVYATGATTLVNAGAITSGGTGGVDAVTIVGQATVTNTGTITSALAGGSGIAVTGAGSTITNSGTITGSNNATYGFGVQNAAVSGLLTITNQSGGVIAGGQGSILLNGGGDALINLLAGSTANGQILSYANGTHTLNIAGTLNGAYNAAAGSGLDYLTLASTGSMTSAALGAGADSFTYQGGAFSGAIDGGADTDGFISALGAGSASLNLSSLSNFETFAHQSGTLTLTGTGAFSSGSSITGGSLIVNGALQSDASVASGAALSGGGSITGVVSIANGASLNNTQGSTLTMGSLLLGSGSAINATFSGTGGAALFAVTGDLVLDGTVNVASTGAYGFGVYGLMTYGGLLTNNGLVVGTTPGGAERVQVQTSVAGQVNIVHAPTELLFWDGGNGAQHDNGAVNGGSGAWTAAGSEWTDVNGAFNGAMEPQPGFAIFQGTGGVVTVDNSLGAVGVTGMQFATDGYRIEGDSVTLANANTNIRVGDGTLAGAAWTATIASSLTGTGGLVKTDLGRLILAGENDYAGGTNVTGGTLQIGDGGTTGSILGSVVLNGNSALIFSRNDNHDFANSVSGTGSVRVSGLATLSGNITASLGVRILSGSSLTNAGVITVSTQDAVTLANGGTFTNTGTVNGSIKNNASAATVTNAGSINGVVYNAGTGLLTIDNQAGASIVGAPTAVTSTAGGAVALNNAGDISGANYAFLSNNASDSVTNSGRMVAGSIAGAVVTQGNLDAIRLNAGGSVTNQSGGLITGAQGVASYAGVLTLNNQSGGTITGVDYGVHAYTTGNIVNAGTIGATKYAGIALAVGGTVTNSGTIDGGSEAGANQGIVTEGAATIVNLAGGVINNGIANFGSGLLDLDIQAGSTVSGGIVNFSTGGGVLRLAGTLNGNYAGSSGNDLVTVISGATVNGVLQGNGGVDSFVLAGAGAGTINIGNVLGFESRAMNGAGVWTLTGFDNSTVGWAINSGTLAASGGSAINDAVAVTIAAPGALQLNASERIGALQGAGSVALGSSTLTVGGAGASNYAGVISGSGGLTVTGGGVLTLSGANTYTGATTASGATLRLGASNVFSNATNLTASFAGVIDMGAFNDTVASATFFTGTRLDGTGTLTAAGYTTWGAVFNANLGAGTLNAVGGTTTLNGTVGAEQVILNGGSVTLGASNRLADAANVSVAAGSMLNLGAFNDTIAALALNGTLQGSGTLTAGVYALNGATVNANLGTGLLFNVGGISTLNGVSNANLVAVDGGTLRLGASNRIVDTADLQVSTGATFDLGAFNETVHVTEINGTLAGTGTLTAVQHQLNGATVNANLAGGPVYVVGGASTLNGLSNGGLLSVLSGSLTLGASNRIADGATLGVSSGATLNMGAFNETVSVAALAGTLNGTGTLTAGEYDLNGATINANLGAGNLFNTGGVSTLNGASGAANVVVQAGTLALGASNRLADTATVSVASGSTLNLNAFNDTVGTALINGTLAGTGTLTAAQYQLNGAAVNANLGAGNLFNVGGVSTLTGTSGAANVVVQAGTLGLGASNRLADNATVSVASGATLNLGAFNDTVALALLNGTLAGTGTLTAGEYDLNGATINANLGAGNLFNVGGVSTLNGLSGAGLVSVQGGTLTLGGSNRLADAATVSVSSGATLNLGAFNDTVALALLNGTLAGTGTLTAGEYDLNGATINANLGAGNLFNVGGVSTLTGTSGAANVVVQAGTLSLGASNRLADTANVTVAAGSILNLNAFNDTVGLAVVNGTVNGTGTVTAAQYQLNAATVNANFGAGALFNLGGVSTLNGTAAASQVSINAGTLRLGANERLSDTAVVSVASGATFNVNGFNERVGALFGTGNVDVGAGRLTFGGVESGFGGRLSGTGSVVHTGGLFTLLGDHTIASISNTGGELRFAGTTTGGLSASGGSVTGAGTIGGALTASNGAVLSPGLAGVQNGIGGFTAGGLTLNGATLAIDVLGRSGGNLIDQLRINGAATLTGGILAPTFQGATSNFDFSTRYMFLQANNLIGTFANGSAFTAASQEGLFWRVRYDLAPNAAVLELRQLTNFDPGATGTGNQRSVGQALSGGQLGASDDWAAVLSLIAGLSAADRAAAFDSISGEPLADVTTSMFSANDSFLNAVRDGGLGGRDDGGEALNFVGALSFVGGPETSADRLGDVLNAYDPSASTSRGAGGWVAAYSGDQTLDGKPGQATVESTLNGFAGGYGSRRGAMSIGAAGGITRLEGDVAARQGHYESDLSHAAGYVAYDDGIWAADVTASFYGGDLDTRRGITVGAFNGMAIGNTHVEGQALSASVARRFQLSDDGMIALGAIGTASNASVDGYTETGAGALSLQASGQERDWQSLQLSARATQDYRVNGQRFRIYGGAGVMAMAGDRQATGDMRFSGAPVGFGSFTVEGAEAPPVAGLADFGVEVGAGEGVTISAGYRGLFSERLQDNQVGIKLRVNW